METITDSNNIDDTFANSSKEDNNVTEEDCSNETNSVLDIDTSLEDKTDIAQFCRHCGKKIEPDSKFCKYCGGRLDYDEKKLTFYLFISKIVNFIKSIFSACLKFIKLRCPNMKKLKKVLKVIIITLLSILAIIGVYYYFDEVVPENEAEDVLYSEKASLNSLQGDSLFAKCNDIICYDIPGLDKDSRYGWGVYRELSEVAWQKVEELAYDGNSKAQFLLGLKYYGYIFDTNKFYWDKDSNGNFQNHNIDLARAAYWFLKAAGQNHSAAQNNIGQCYRYGTGVEINMEKAIYWTIRSATNENDYGQLNYGDLIRDACYNTEDEKDSRIYIDTRVYCHSSNLKPKQETDSVNLFVILHPSIDRAKEYWKKSADQGNIQAKERLEKIYE